MSCVQTWDAESHGLPDPTTMVALGPAGQQRVAPTVPGTAPGARHGTQAWGLAAVTVPPCRNGDDHRGPLHQVVCGFRFGCTVAS